MYRHSFVLFSIFGAILAAYPQHPYEVPNFPSGSNHQQHLPPYLISPKGIYVLVNGTNATQSNRGKDRDFVFGVRGPRDQLLLRTSVFKRAKFWSSYVTKEITFPPPKSSFKVNISQMVGHDRGINGTGGFVKIIGGGIGTGNVTLLFSSLKNMAINFGLEIFGTIK